MSRQLFRDRNFCLYSTASISSWLCFFVQTMATSWLAWDLSHSAGTLGLVAFLDTAPYFLFGPFAGVLADRHDRLKILYAAYFCAMVQSGLLALASFSGFLNIPFLAVLAFLHGTIHAFSVPAAYGLLPRAVEPKNLSAAIAFSSSYRTLALFAGPALAGVLIANFPIAVSFLTNALAYALYLVVLKKLRLPPLEKAAVTVTSSQGLRGYCSEFLDGLHYALRHPLIGMLLLVTFFNDGLRRLTGSLLPVFADRLFSHGPNGLAILAGATGVGAAVAALLLAKRRETQKSLQIIQWGFAVTIVATVIFVSSGTPWLAVGSRLVLGLAGEAVLTSTTILLQAQVDDGYRSRVMGNAFLISQLASLSLVATGPISSLFGLDQMIDGFAAMACAALVAFWFYFGRGKAQ